jgi:hypothetical protein
VDIKRRRRRGRRVGRERPGWHHGGPPSPAPLTARTRGRLGRARQPSIASERQEFVAIGLHNSSFQSNGYQCHFCIWVAGGITRYLGVALRLSVLQWLPEPGWARSSSLESSTSVTSWRLNSKRAQKRATLADRPCVGVGMRLRVSARAPPYRGDRSILDRLRAGECHTRAHADILPGRAIGRGNVEKGCHEIGTPREGGEKITDPLHNCKANARSALMRAAIGRVSPRIR